MGLERIPEFGASPSAALQALRINCTTISKDMPQPGKAKTHRFQHFDRAIAVLNVGGVDEDEDHEAASVGKDMRFSTLELLPAS